jgi:hypothetical protein
VFDLAHGPFEGLRARIPDDEQAAHQVKRYGPAAVCTRGDVDLRRGLHRGQRLAQQLLVPRSVLGDAVVGEPQRLLPRRR